MNVLIAISCLCLLTVCAAHKKKLTVTVTDTPCTPNRPEQCGDRVLLSEEITVLPEEEGENVCEATKYFQVQTIAYVEVNYCRGSCITYCVSTKNCTGPVVNETESEKSCCDGFVEDSTASSSGSRGKGKSLNCTIMLRESVADCLLELNLESFTVQLLTESPELTEELGNAESSESYTIFALTDASLEGEEAPASLLGHVANGASNGKALPTLAEEVYLHIGRASIDGSAEKSFFVNGVEVTELNACQARNGMVHIVASAIPQSNTTIAAQLSEDSRFSTFLELLDGAEATDFLDVADGKSRTVLAPTNDAFAKLPENAIDCLLLPENIKYLKRLVLSHISAPAQYSATLSQQSRLSTFNRHYRLRVQVEDGEILLTSDLIPLEESDISANNGVIHALPDVIVPSNVDFDKLNCDNIELETAVKVDLQI